LFFHINTRDKKRVFTLHENPMEFRQNWGKASLKTIVSIINKDRRGSRFIAPSVFYRDVFSKMILAPIDVIPHSINFDFLKRRESKKETLRRYGLSEKKFTILFPSRLELTQKRPQLGLRAIKRIREHIRPAQIILTGVDDQYQRNKDYLRKIMDGTGIDTNFINFSIDEMGNAYNIADLVILPSRYESFGYSAVESLAMRKRTVLSNIPTFREISVGNDYTFMTETNTPKGVADAILKAIRSKSKKSVKKWADKYNRNCWIKKYIDFYKTVL